MRGCRLFDNEQSKSFYSNEVSGSTTYTIDEGRGSGIVSCGRSAKSKWGWCTRTPISGEYLTDQSGHTQHATTSNDNGYYEVHLTSLADNVAAAIVGTTVASVDLPVVNSMAAPSEVTSMVPPSTVTSMVQPIAPAASPTSPVASETRSAAASASASADGGGVGDTIAGGRLSHSGEIGVGVGLAIGVVFAAAAAWLGWKKWRARRSPKYSPPELYFGSVKQGVIGRNGEAEGHGTEMTDGGFR